MTLRDSLAQVQELVAGMTPGALTVYDANEGDGWPPRPLWCFKNDAYDSGDEPALQGSIHYGGKEDADAIVAAVNFIREHGPALLRDAGDASDSARLDWLCSGDLKMVEESPARCFRVYRDIAPPENPHAQWHAFTEAVFPSARAAIDAAMHAPGGAGGGS